MNVPLTPVRFLRYAHAHYPDNTVGVCGDQRFTYTQFAVRVSRLAGALRECCVKRGDRVAFLSSNCHRLLEAGAVLLPLNIRLTPDELVYILNNSGFNKRTNPLRNRPIVYGPVAVAQDESDHP